MKLFITGAAGYIGGMLVELYLNDPQVEKVVALDFRKPGSHFPLDNPKIVWIDYNLGDDGWQERVLKEGPIDVVIHCAYVIRQPYGKKKREWQIKSNIVAANKVFEFVFKNNIKKFIHFSTVASYGAHKNNSPERWFKEEDPLREDKYLYGVDKKIIEENLFSFFNAEKDLAEKGLRKSPLPKVAVLRPCAVTGGRGQFVFKRFGLIQMVKEGLPIIPITSSVSARQFIHEDDLAEIVDLLVKKDIGGQYEIFNAAPADYLLLTDMAKLLNKKAIKIPKWLGWLAFFTFWHISRGKIPTVPPSINSYTYPIIVDGSKITKFGFKYKYNCVQALRAKEGRYGREKIIEKD